MRAFQRASSGPCWHGCQRATTTVCHRCRIRCTSTQRRGRAKQRQNGYWKLQYPRALSDISASKPPPTGGFANQAQVGFFFTNGVGGVNGAARIGATLPRGRICGWLTSTAEGAFGDFLVVGFLVAMAHHGRDRLQKQVMDVTTASSRVLQRVALPTPQVYALPICVAPSSASKAANINTRSCHRRSIPIVRFRNLSNGAKSHEQSQRHQERYQESGGQDPERKEGRQKAEKGRA